MTQKLRLFAIAFLLFVHVLPLQAQPPRIAEKKMWLYFDLGDTLISTKDMKRLHYFDGVRQYLRNLRLQGFKIGMITNIPESWGLDYPQKLNSLKKVIAEGWAESAPFEWELFDEIVLPMRDQERKPAPTLFLEAIQKSQGCPSAYIGESSNEILAAAHEGMATKLFVPEDPELFIPPTKVRAYLLENYKLRYDPACLLRPRLR